MKGLFCGSFDPFTFGHLYVVKKALERYDELIICVGKNNEKTSLFSANQRAELIKQVLKNQQIANVEIISTDGMTVDVAQKYGVDALIRGVRPPDWEKERTFASINAELAKVRGFELKTELILQNDELLSAVSSSIVKMLCQREEYITLLDMVPAEVHQMLVRNNLYQMFGAISESEDAVAQYVHLVKNYCSRGYHNFSHLAYLFNMLNIFIELSETWVNARIYRLAIFAHDCIHNGKSDDEEKSAEEAKKWCPVPYWKKVKKLVLATKHDRDDLDGDEALMADLDLSILGTHSQNVWNWYCVGVRKENLEFDDASYKAGRIQFLSELLAKKRIFHTDFFYNMLEDQARKNIENELQKLRA